MKAYCINLENRTDRLDYMANEFSRVGMPFERMIAVDGQDPDIIAQAKESNLNMDRYQISTNAYACFQSHRKVWQALVDSDEKYAMVFEDDLIFANDISQYLDEAWIPDNAGLIRLETFNTRVHVDSGAGHSAGPRRLVRMRSRHVGAGCYVLSAEMARFLLNETKKIEGPVDEVLFNDQSRLYNELNVYQMCPAPAIQGKREPSGGGENKWVESSILERSFGGDSGASKKTESFAARIKRRVQEEWTARQQGTNYIVIPFG